MKLDFKSLAFGYSLQNGVSTPAWETALGQGAGYKLKDLSTIDELVKGMIYKAVAPKSITFKKGRGGAVVRGDADNANLVIAAVFDKVFINEQQINGGQFILLIVKDDTEHHKGRLKLKYGLDNAFTNREGIVTTNRDFQNIVTMQLGFAKEACWFVYDISIENQDTLRLRAIVVNKDGSMTYANSAALHSAWEALIEADCSLLEESVLDGIDLSQSICYSTGYQTKFSYNRILFGAPGTGKSFELNRDRKELLYGNPEVDESKLDLSQFGKYERVTFHPDYSYANFVGTYKPVQKEDNSDVITYEYVPGPFMRILVKALKSARDGENKPYLLVIEEINRANVAAVFGDVFQLLDRASDNASEYEIATTNDMRAYLAKELNVDKSAVETIKIPDNMFIWATMNSADQGVFPMDTAFKRRWDFKYLGINENDEKIRGKYVTAGSPGNMTRVEWNALRKAINDYLAEQRINEDKQLGPYFISKEIVVPADGGNEINSEKFCEVFKHKVLMYLFEDIVKQKNMMFKGSAKGYNRYSQICEAFDEQGFDIFCPELKDKISPKIEYINDVTGTNDNGDEQTEE